MQTKSMIHTLKYEYNENFFQSMSLCETNISKPKNSD